LVNVLAETWPEQRDISKLFAAKSTSHNNNNNNNNNNVIIIRNAWHFHDDSLLNDDMSVKAL